jgi:hypothetical protein
MMNYGLFQPVASISGNQTQPFFNYVNTSSLYADTLSGRGVALITIANDYNIEIREYLHTFHNHFRNINIYDLGILLSREPDTIAEVINTLRQHQIIPFFIGASEKLAGQICEALSGSVHHITNKPLIQADRPDLHNHHSIAYQRHLISLEEMYFTESNSLCSISLGKMRTFSGLLEPILRDSQILLFNINAMKSSEAGDIHGLLPTGLTAEELCQVMQHAGNASDLQAVITAWPKEAMLQEKTAALMAEAFWYFCEGCHMNTGDHPAKGGDFSEFIVYSQQMDEQFDFIRHNPTMKWWLKKTTDESRNQYLSCAYEEYQSAVANEISDRLFRFQHEG